MVLIALAVPVIALLGYAWTDGGRQPLRDIVEPLPVPRAPAGTGSVGTGPGGTAS